MSRQSSEFSVRRHNELSAWTWRLTCGGAEIRSDSNDAAATVDI